MATKNNEAFRRALADVSAARAAYDDAVAEERETLTIGGSKAAEVYREISDVRFDALEIAIIAMHEARKQ